MELIDIEGLVDGLFKKELDISPTRPNPVPSALPVGLIIHWFYFFLFMYVSLSE